MFQVVLSKPAVKALRAMPRNVSANIMERLGRLAVDPGARDPQVTKLVNRPELRLRVGSYRVLYSVDEARQVIDVKVIRPRGSAYR